MCMFFMTNLRLRYQELLHEESWGVANCAFCGELSCGGASHDESLSVIQRP